MPPHPLNPRPIRAISGPSAAYGIRAPISPVSYIPGQVFRSPQPCLEPALCGPRSSFPAWFRFWLRSYREAEAPSPSATNAPKGRSPCTISRSPYQGPTAWSTWW